MAQRSQNKPCDGHGGCSDRCEIMSVSMCSPFFKHQTEGAPKKTTQQPQNEGPTFRILLQQVKSKYQSEGRSKTSQTNTLTSQWLRSKLVPGTTFLYMCFFVNNQYRILLDHEGAGSRDWSLGEAGWFDFLGFLRGNQAEHPEIVGAPYQKMPGSHFRVVKLYVGNHM